MSVIAIKFS